MRALGRMQPFPWKCGCGCNYWEDLFPGPQLCAHWTVLSGSATIPWPTRQAVARAVLGEFVVAGATIDDGGAGYTMPPMVIFSGGGGSGAAGRAELAPDGTVVRIDITAGGYYYSSAPDVSLVAGSGAVATATIYGDGAVYATLVAGGANYATAPEVVFSGGDGTGAAAVAIMDGGSVIAIVMLNNGSGYTVPPTIGFGRGGPTRAAAATAAVTGGVVGLIVDDGGAGYSQDPQLVFTGGGGGGARSTAAIAAGAVTGLSSSAGSVGDGFASAPTVAFSGGGGGQVALTAGTMITSDVLSPDETAYGVAMIGVLFPSGAPPASAVRLCCNCTDADNYAFAEYRADGTVHVGTRSGGTDAYAGTWFQADIPVLGTRIGDSNVIAPLPFQVCFRPDRLIGTALYRADGFDANQVGAGIPATIASSKCGVVVNAAATLGAIVTDFRFNLGADKNTGCAACAPACGTWGYSDIDAILSYGGICQEAPAELLLELPSGLDNGVTGIGTQGVDGVVVTNGGAGYFFVGQTITVNFTGGGGTGAVGHVATVDGAGHVSGVAIDNPGSGYTSLPTVSFSDPNGGTGAAGTASLATFYVSQPCSGCSALSGEYVLGFCPWDASGADHDPAPWANGQCYPAHPVPPTYYGAVNVPGGQCKWCYYGATALCDNDTLFQAGVGIFAAAGGYKFAADLYLSSLPIPNVFDSAYYNVMLWQAHYESAVLSAADCPNCTDGFDETHSLNLDLVSHTNAAWFGGHVCGDPWSSLTLRFSP